MIGRGPVTVSGVVPIPAATTGGLYPYAGRFWIVPKDYVLPKSMLLKQAWFCWINGLPANRMEGENGAILSCPIKPFRFVNPKTLPPKLRHKFWNDFLAFMLLMYKTPDINLPHPSKRSTIEFIDSSFEKEILYVKTQCDYLFVNESGKNTVLHIVQRRLSILL